MMKKNKLVYSLIFLLMSYFLIVLSGWNVRNYYKMSINCGTVIKVIENSEYKTQPSIIVDIGLKNIEIIQFENFHYNFKLMEVGDKICKEPNNHNFIRIKKNQEIEIVKSGFSNDILAWLFWTPNKPVIIDKIKSSCECL